MRSLGNTDWPWVTKNSHTGIRRLILLKPNSSNNNKHKLSNSGYMNSGAVLPLQPGVLSSLLDLALCEWCRDKQG